MENLKTHDGVEIKKGMRVARSDSSGFLESAVVTGFKYGLVVIKCDGGWSETRNACELYAR